MSDSSSRAGQAGHGASAAGPGDSSNLKATVTTCALESGFDLVRVASADEFSWDRAVALERLRAGLMDGLPWFNESRVLRGSTPESLLPGARSIICLGLNYFQACEDGPASGPPVGKVARYAWGRDYHKVVKKRMAAYVQGLRVKLGAEFAARWYIDDGPMLDRAASSRSGLGWFGKNTNILTPSLGSWVFLGQIITDLEIEPDQPLKKTCGSCVRCIDACPTGAIVAPYTLDNSRCISHLTIENRGEIPIELRPLIGDWVFGCDICQDVCPVNLKGLALKPTLWCLDQASPAAPADACSSKGPAYRTQETSESASQQGQASPAKAWSGSQPPRKIETLELIVLLEMSEEEFRSRFRGSAILRAKRVGLQRNACVALGNCEDRKAVPALRRALAEGETLVRGHAAWALGQIGGVEALQALEQAGADEEDAGALREISAALRMLMGA